VVERLSKAFAKASADPAVQARLAGAGMVSQPKLGAEFGKFMHEQSVTWRRVIELNRLNLVR
jgi:tripartite-type tricarboxylate transporter receptor subunit TctC